MSLDIPVDPVIEHYTLNNTNSNANHLIEILPDRISHNISFFINPNMDIPPTGLGNDFIYYNSEMKAKLDIEIPLSLIASDLVLSDTFDVSINESQLENINNGKLYLYVINHFPLAANIEFYLLTSSGKRIGELNVASVVKAAIYNPATQIVETPSLSKLIIPVTEADLEDLVWTRMILAKIRFDSRPKDHYVRIYNTYSMQMTLSADVDYHIEIE